MPKFMGFSATSPASEKGDPTAENRVWGFFGEAPEMSRQNRPQTLQPRQGNRPVTTRIASGRAYWPSRDPIGENWDTGEFNKYAFIRNESFNDIDILGLKKRKKGDGNGGVSNSNTRAKKRRQQQKNQGTGRIPFNPPALPKPPPSPNTSIIEAPAEIWSWWHMWDTIAENDETDEKGVKDCDAAIAAAKKFMLYPDPDCICWCCVKVSKMDAAAGGNIGGKIAIAKETLLNTIAVPGSCQGKLAQQTGKDQANPRKYAYGVFPPEINPDGTMRGSKWLSIQYEEYVNTKGEPKCDGR